MSFARKRAARHVRLQQAANFQVEGLERRVLLSTAIAAFGMQQTFAVGISPIGIALADVNRDGKADLLVANGNSVGVLLGSGDGTFQAQRTFAASAGVVLAGDFNADGKPDLLVVDSAPYSVGILLGNGDGTFEPQQTFAIGSRPEAAAVADLNGDGKLDVLVANSADGTVGVLLGNGNGTLQPQQTLAVGRTPFSVAIADVNRDGRPDLLAGNFSDNSVSVLLGNGDGTFQAEQTFATGTFPQSLAVADLNGDGKLDLVTADRASGTASVLLGNGDGTFQAALSFAAGLEPWSVAVADVNADSKADVMVADRGSNAVSVLLGNGDGTFQAQKTFGAGVSPQSLAVSDVNGDGRADLVVANTGSKTAGVLLGDVPPTVLSINRTSPPGPITSDSSVTYTVTFNEAVTGVDSTDFSTVVTGGVTATPPVVVSGGGAIYSITINGVAGTGTLGLNLVDDGSIKDAAGNPLQPGAGSMLQPPQTYATAAVPGDIAVADMNGDGRADLIVTNRANPGSIGVFLGNGDGTFQPQQTFPTAPNPSSIEVADVNGDGRADVIAAGVGATSILLGNGNGTFQSPQTLALSAISIVGADLNGDGKLDFIVIHPSSAGGTSAGVLLGNGDGSFKPEQTFATGSSYDSIAVADVNGDGRPDLIIASYRGVAQVFIGGGDGTFQPAQSFSTGVYPASVAAADINNDGITDLVFPDSRRDGDSVSIQLGNGDGTFRPPHTFDADYSTFAHMAVADMNQDGKTDIVLAAFDGVSVLPGAGDGTFRAPQTYIVLFGPVLAVGDLNGDGRPDLVLARGQTSGIGVMLAGTDGGLSGQTYKIVPRIDVIAGSSGIDSVALAQNPDHLHIDWTLNGTTAEVAINDPNGLTINGNGGNDTITLDYTNGSPLPNIVHLNGTFTINGLQGSNPLAGAAMEIGRSTVFIGYGSSDPIAAIQSYLQAGYDAGAWNGSPTATTGVITSAAAQANSNHTTGIGYADSADGQGVNMTANTIELTYTVYGDANLDHQVNSADLQILLFSLNRPGSWDQGDFNYDAQVNSADLQELLFNLNTSLGNQIAAATYAARGATGIPQQPVRSSAIVTACSSAVSATRALGTRNYLRPSPRRHR